MAQSYNRKINLYINIDGKEVKNNVASIRGEMSKLVNSQNQMTIGSEEYRKQTQKIQQLKTVLKGHAETIGQIQTPMQKAITTAKSLLPAFSFAALGALATQAFGKITSATDAMADKWEIAMAGMKNGTDYFWRSLASGDFTNFLSNLSEAIKVGEKYAKILDSVEDKIRSLSIVESDSRAEVLRLEEAVKNKQLSKEDRIKAGEARIKLEEDLSAKRTKIADEEFGAEILISSQRTGLSKDQLMQITKDIDSESKLKADAYNQQIEHYNQLKRQNVFTTTSPTTGGSSTKQLPDSQEMINLKKELDSAPDSVKAYAGAINQYSNLTKDMMDRLASSYIKKNTAEDSAIENTMKVRNLVHTLLAGQEETGERFEDMNAKKRKEAADKALEILEAANIERISKITDQYIQEGWTDAKFKSEQLIAEQAFLILKKAMLEEFGMSTVDIQNQINQKRIESQAATNAAINKSIADAQTELETQQEESQKTQDDAITALIDRTNAAIDNIQKSKDKEAEILEARKNMYLEFAGAIGQTFGDLLNDQEATMAVYLKATLLLALESLHQWVRIEEAKIMVSGIAKGLPGIAIAVAKIAAIEILFAAVKGALSKQSTPKHAAGGFTQGETTYIAGEAGTEYIAPNWQVKHPLTGPIIAQLESWRKNPISVSSGAIETNRSIAASVTNSTYNKNFSKSDSIQVSSDPELKSVLAENTKAIKELMNWKPNIVINEYERKRDNWKKTTTGGLK